MNRCEPFAFERARFTSLANRRRIPRKTGGTGNMSLRGFLKELRHRNVFKVAVACLMAWGFEFREGGVRSIPRVPKETKPALPAPEVTVPPTRWPA